MLYRTYFKLINPVIDFDEASKYLTEDSMIAYLKTDSRIPKELVNKLIDITWRLKTESSGCIDLLTKEELTTKELSFISDWVSGQNSDGLGEGFEQQDFACYPDEEDEDEYIMASFDWETNDYEFTLIHT